MRTWLIGAGFMAREYSKVLLSQNINFDVIGRGDSSAQEFESLMGKPVFTGGLKVCLKSMEPPDQAIVAVGVEDLSKTAQILIECGVKRILLEKPGGINFKEIKKLKDISKKNSSTLLLAYNRRFYASTAHVREMIKDDGGVSSFNFEFTEWSHAIAPLVKGPGVKESWFLSNSSHLVDLAFHICGFPKELHALNAGSLAWHPSSSVFSGSGKTDQNILFSYIADWTSAGRWRLEIMTSKRRIILSPLEEIKIIKVGSLVEDKINISDELDVQFKPGIYEMLNSFFAKDDKFFCSIEEQLSHLEIYNKMAGYSEN